MGSHPVDFAIALVVGDDGGERRARGRASGVNTAESAEARDAIARV